VWSFCHSRLKVLFNSWVQNLNVWGFDFYSDLQKVHPCTERRVLKPRCPDHVSAYTRAFPIGENLSTLGRTADIQRRWRGRTETMSSLGVCMLADRDHRRGTTVLLPADTCRQGEQACIYSRSAPPLSTSAADAGLELRARTLTRKTPAEQQSSSPTEAASAGTAECRRGSHFSDPAASERVT